MEYTPNLKKKYINEIINNLKGNYKSVMQVPRLEKICLNQGVGSGSSDKKLIEAAQQEMTMITGQKALITRSTKDISNFKLRKGMPVGVMVTLRADKMYEFLERFITATLPRVRDFKGLELKGFDGRGNYTMGMKEQIAFPEISIDKINKITGMDITFVTNTNSDDDALILLKELGLPFKDRETKVNLTSSVSQEVEKNEEVVSEDVEKNEEVVSEDVEKNEEVVSEDVEKDQGDIESNNLETK